LITGGKKIFVYAIHLQRFSFFRNKLENIKERCAFLYEPYTYLSNEKSHSQGKGCNQSSREPFPREGIS
jgi:hypothetical protein